MRPFTRPVAAAAVAVLVIACPERVTDPGKDSTPVAIAATTVVEQTATAGSPVAEQPAVRVSNAAGHPIADVPVVFAITEGGGILSGAATQTNESGVAVLGQWKLGAVVGANRVSASAVGLQATVAFVATGVAGPASNLTFATPPSTTADNRVVLSSQPVIQVQDVNGNAVAQAGIEITAAMGNATLSGVISAITSASGAAAFTNLSISGGAGAKTLTFSATGLSSAEANVTLRAGAADAIARDAGHDQTAVAGSAVATPPSVRVTDADDNPVAGIAVTFAVVSGGGSAAGGSTTTNGSGIARVGGWTLGATQGPNALRATAQGVSSAVTFEATGIAGTAATIVANSITTQSTPVGTAVSTRPSVIVRDANGNPVAGLGVVFSVAEGGGTVTAASTTTNTSGVAEVGTWTLGVIAGTNRLNATAMGVSADPVVFIAMGDAGPATQLAFTVQPANATAGVGIPVEVKARDTHGNTASSFTGMITVALGVTHGATLLGTASVAALGGVATFGSLSVNKAASGYTLAASSESLSGSTSSSFNITPAAPAKLGFLNQPVSVIANAPLNKGGPITVGIQDQFGNVVTGATNPITIAVSTNPGGAILSGTQVHTPSQGIANLGPDVAVDRGSSGLTLAASALGLTKGTSAPFDVAPHSTATKLSFVNQPTNVLLAGPFASTVRVAVKDQYDNVVSTTTSATAMITLDAGTGSPKLGGTLSVNAVSGVATFTDLHMLRAGAGFRITAIAPQFGQITSETFDVNNGATVLWTFTTNRPAFAMAGSNIFFGDELALYRISTSGGTPVKLADANPQGMKTDGSFVYWMEPSPDGAQWVIKKVPVGGGAVITIPTGAFAADQLIQLGDNHIFYMSIGIIRAAKDGTQPHTRLNYGESSRSVWLIDNSFAYFGARDNASYRGPAAGGGPLTLVTTATAELRFVAGSEAYYSKALGNGLFDLWAVPVTGGTARRVTGEGEANKIVGVAMYGALAGEYLYMSTSAGIVSMKPSGGPIVEMDPRLVMGLGMDATHAYWIRFGVGASSTELQIVKVPLR